MGFFAQYGRLLLIIIKLKSWRFVFMLIVIAALFSNHFLYSSMSTRMQTMNEKDLTLIDPKDFARNNIIVSLRSLYGRQLDRLVNTTSRMIGSDFSSNMEDCDSQETCNAVYFRNLIGKRSGMYAHFIEFEKGANFSPKILCHMALGAELHCPFLTYLMIMSLVNGTHDHELLSTSVFRLMSSVKTLETVRRGADTTCKTDANFLKVFPRTVMSQMICVAVTLIFYVFVCTATCLYELKQNGYIQLMFRKGLGVIPFWLAIWTITLVEMAIFAALLTVSYMIQCNGFFMDSQLIDTFVGAFIQFCNVAATILLFSVLTRHIELIGTFATIYALIIVAIIVANQQYLKNAPGVIQYSLLAFPAGYLAEQAYENLMSDSVKMGDATKLVMYVSAGAFAFKVLITIYLDCVFKSGNGWRLPVLYYFLPDFWSRSDRHRPESDTDDYVMFESTKSWWHLTVATKELKKKFYRCCQTGSKTVLNNFSVNFYKDQITAVVGHNGSGKSVLMQILSGDREATAGQAYIDGISITTPLSRYHICSSVGYCPQVDALVNRMSVSDTLKLAVLSADYEWSEWEDRVKQILFSLGMEDNMGESIQRLSCSEKRKISVTLALIGDPRVILLDDPTRDMDYLAKRRLWNLLHDYKIGHCVIVSTLFIHEAESVADRIVFLSGGRVICVGSPFFFKRAFDCRFIIQIACKTEFHVPYLIRKITSKFKSVRVRSFSNADVEFEVPITEDQLLSTVTAEIEKLYKLIDEYGIVNYSLEDVFLKLKPLQPQEVNKHFELGTIGYVADDIERMQEIMKRQQKPVEPPSTESTVERDPLLLRAIVAMLISSCIRTYRSKARIVTRIVVPILLVAAICFGAVLERSQENDKLTLWVRLNNSDAVEEKRGVCLFPKSPDPTVHFDNIDQTDCARMLNGYRILPPETTPIGLDVTKYQWGNLQEALLRKDNLNEIKSACRQSKPVCPVIFGNDFCPDKKPFVKNHSISVGAFITTETYKPEDFVATTMMVYENMAAIMIKKFYNSSTAVKSTVNADGISDIKRMFFNFYGLFMLMALVSVLPVLFMDDVINDRKLKIKNQLMSMGMSLLQYWLSIFFSHWLQLIVYFLFGVIPLMALLPTGYTNVIFFLVILPLTLTFGLVNNLLAAYAVSTLVDDNSYIIITFYAFLCLLVAMSALLIQANDVFGEILVYTFPQFAAITPLFYGMRFIYYTLSYFSSMNLGAPSPVAYVYSVPHIRASLIALPLHFILLILLLVLMETCHRCCGKGQAATEPKAYDDCTEPAVLSEINKVITQPRSSSHVLQVRQLKAINPDGHSPMRNLTFGLQPGEVFGLLGPTGCGNSAAVRAIAVDHDQDFVGLVDWRNDNVWLSNAELHKQGGIGYCPRTDPLYKKLTVRENLNFYATVVGISNNRVNQLIDALSLSKDDLEAVVEHASVGVRRRTSLALAWMADAPLMAIDHVSCGVDHEGRSILWAAIKSMVCKRRGILLATQSMDEAETICNRMCILNHGLMVAICDIKDLIFRYRKMYFLETQISSDGHESVNSFNRRKTKLAQVILDRFFGAILIEQWTSRMQFAVPIQSIGCLSNSLDWLYDNKEKLGLLYFTLHYATIDQVMKAIIVHSELRMMKNLDQPSEVSV